MLTRRIAIGSLLVAVIAGCAAPQTGSEASSLDARTAAVLASSFTGAPPEWQQRLVQDEVQKQCSTARGKPSGDVAGAIVLSQQDALKYPDSGLMAPFCCRTSGAYVPSAPRFRWGIFRSILPCIQRASSLRSCTAATASMRSSCSISASAPSPRAPSWPRPSMA